MTKLHQLKVLAEVWAPSPEMGKALLDSFAQPQSLFSNPPRLQVPVYVQPRVDAEIRFLTIDSAGMLLHGVVRTLPDNRPHGVISPPS
jgi:hypothetical protein